MFMPMKMDVKGLLTKEEALFRLFEKWQPDIKVETIPIEQSKGRILAKNIFALYTLPVVRAAIMDSVALSSNDFENGMPDTSLWKRGVEYDFADMGDDFDDRYDAAIRVEDVSFSADGTICINDDVKVVPGMGIKAKGDIVCEGQLLLTKGRKIMTTDLAVLAVGGITEIFVYKKPIIAIIPTGSELIARGTKPERGQNIDANSIMLENMLLEMGAEPLCYPIVKDDPKMLSESLEDALVRADVVVVNGGSSKGSEDFCTKLLHGRGEFLFHGVARVPGRPLGMAVTDGKPVINLPGPTVAAFNGTDWCLRAIVARILQSRIEKRPTVRAILTEDLCTPMPMEYMARLNITKGEDGCFYADPLSKSRDFVVRSIGANGVFISPIGFGEYLKGTEIEVELLCQEEYI